MISRMIYAFYGGSNPSLIELEPNPPTIVAAFVDSIYKVIDGARVIHSRKTSALQNKSVKAVARNTLINTDVYSAIIPASKNRGQGVKGIVDRTVRRGCG